MINSSTGEYENVDIKDRTLRDNILDLIYPIGSIYMSVNSVDPSTFIGGTWERIKDTFLLSAGDTYTAGSSGGEATHTLSDDEMPSHSHDNFNIDGVYTFGWEGGNKIGFDFLKAGMAHNSDTVSERMCTGSRGGSQAHNNMPPYLTVYMWKRIE